MHDNINPHNQTANNVISFVQKILKRLSFNLLFYSYMCLFKPYDKLWQEAVHLQK